MIKQQLVGAVAKEKEKEKTGKPSFKMKMSNQCEILHFRCEILFASAI